MQTTPTLSVSKPNSTESNGREARRRVRIELLTWKRGHGAGGDGLGRLLDLDEAHAAVAGDGETAVVAEPRDVDAGDLAGLEHGEPLGDPHGVPVHEHLERVLRVAGELHPRPSHGLPGGGVSGSAGATAAPASGDPAAAVGEIQRHDAATAGGGGARERRYGLEWRIALAKKAMAATDAAATAAAAAMGSRGGGRGGGSLLPLAGAARLEEMDL